MSKSRSPSTRLQSKSPAKSVSDLTRSHSNPLKETLQRASHLATLQRELWRCLPAVMRPHCHLANYRDSTLVITADSPVWAARARQLSQQILHTARERCKISPEQVNVRIVPPTESTVPLAGPPPLSEATRDHLGQVADALDDQELGEMMRRLARKPD